MAVCISVNLCALSHSERVAVSITMKRSKIQGSEQTMQLHSTGTGRLNETPDSVHGETEQILFDTEKLRAMGQLTGSLAHEVNNLLTPIMASFEMLSHPDVSVERTGFLTERGLAAANGAKSLMLQLLAFAGRQPLRAVAVDVGRLVSAMAKPIQDVVGPLVGLTLNIDQHFGLANADSAQLELVILNLVSNARDAMPDGGNLRIDVTAASPESVPAAQTGLGPCVRISIEDTGIGMDEVTRARAVEPFFSTKGVGKGVGLGLSTAYGIAGQLGGALTVSSKLGLGTRVELFLPIRAQPANAPRSADRTEGRHCWGGTVLLVDDDDTVRAATADMLMHLGFTVHEASSGEGALGWIQQGGNLDLLVTDYLMPGLSGLDLVCAVRQQRPKTPVLIISGFAEVGAIAPDVSRLAKPFRQTELTACIAALLN
jgi:signal transduction histidine kinase/CheY-like chemotaxis protein